MIEEVEVTIDPGSPLMRPRAQGAPLGPEQLRWLRKNIPSFDLAWRAVQAADENAAKAAKAVGLTQ